jgi:hypothetical protein
VVLFLLHGCKEETSYQMQLVIENQTEENIRIQLFPKAEYMHNGMYSYNDFGSSYRNTILELEMNREIEIFISSDLNIKPWLKAAEVFDSICISDLAEEKYKLVFSATKHLGYPENLYSEDSSWEMKLRNFTLADNFRKNHVESNDYIFQISEEKMSYTRTPQSTHN